MASFGTQVQMMRSIPGCQVLAFIGRVVTVRRMILVLSLVLVGLLIANREHLIRRVRFWQTGTAQFERYTFRLDPQDSVMKDCILRDGGWELQETATIRALLKPGATFIDVGASFGWYTVITSDAVGKEGRVIAFEPAPAALELLHFNVRANGCENVTIEPKALSNHSGKLQLHLHESNKGSHSILASKERTSTVTVDAISLDEYLEDHSGEVDLVKIDTEGAEGIILDGMRETLDRHPLMSIILEFTPELLRQTGYDPNALLLRFLNSGYEVTIIDEYSPHMVLLDEAHAKFLIKVLEQRRKTEYVNLLIRRPSRSGR
jgi:FkbM family methyltransferase